MSPAPHVEDFIMPKNPTGKVSMLEKWLRSYVEIMKDEIVFNTLYDIIYHYIRGMETHVAQRMVNQVLCTKRNNEELRFGAQIG